METEITKLLETLRDEKKKLEQIQLKLAQIKTSLENFNLTKKRWTPTQIIENFLFLKQLYDSESLDDIFFKFAKQERELQSDLYAQKIKITIAENAVVHAIMRYNAYLYTVYEFADDELLSGNITFSSPIVLDTEMFNYVLDMIFVSADITLEYSVFSHRFEFNEETAMFDYFVELIYE